MRTPSENKTTPRRQKQLTFVDLLKEELRVKKQDAVFERDIARRASIDASTLSLIKKKVRIKNPTWELRLRLATALRDDVQGAVDLASRFFAAEPATKPGEGWQESVKSWKAGALQSEIKSIRFGLPLFFDTAPFLIAEKNGYFKQLGLDVSFDYVKWNKALTYFEHLPERNKETIALTICNRNSIEVDNKKDKIAFCFPLALYEPNSFAFWIHENEIQIGAELAKPASAVKKIFQEFTKIKPNPRIIVSGTDMKKGVVEMFVKFAGQSVPDNWFLFLDQFDSLEAFLRGAGHGFVGGVPQRMRMEQGSNHGAIHCVIKGNDVGLDRQFNGIACRRHEFEEQATRKAIGQVLWCWYRALQDIERNLAPEANFIAANMNVHAETITYQAEDFIEFWTNKDYFRLPRSPSEMRMLIESDKNYSHKFYDESNSLYSVVSEIEKLLPGTN